MTLIYDLAIGAGIGTIILIVKYKVKSKDLAEPFNLLSSTFESYFSGFTIYAGLASIYYSLTESLPFGLSTIANTNLISFFGGLSIILITTIWLFRKEILSKGKFIFFKDEDKELSELSIERINYCYSYHKFKKTFGDSELNVIKVFRDGTLQVSVDSLKTGLNKNLLFDAIIKTSEYVEGNKEEIPSQPIAVCRLLIASSTVSTFKVIKWFKIKEYKKHIEDFKRNHNLKTMKPFIKLRNDYVAEKYLFTDLKKVKEGIDNLIKLRGGD